MGFISNIKLGWGGKRIFESIPNTTLALFDTQYRYKMILRSSVQECRDFLDAIVGDVSLDTLPEDLQTILVPAMSKALLRQTSTGILQVGNTYYWYTVCPLCIPFTRQNWGFMLFHEICTETLESYLRKYTKSYCERDVLLRELFRSGLVHFTEAKNTLHTLYFDTENPSEGLENSQGALLKAYAQMLEAYTFLDEDFHTEKEYSLQKLIKDVLREFPNVTGVFKDELLDDPTWSIKKPLLMYALRELVKNAWEACTDCRTETDALIPLVFRLNTGAEGERILCVEDFGVGIPPSFSHDVFSVGFSTSGASGKGLAIANRAIKLLGGTLSLTNFRKPTRFELTL